MKKSLAILLTITFLLCATLAACAPKDDSPHSNPESQSGTAAGEGTKELPVVTVLVDMSQSNLAAGAVSDLLNSTPGYGEEFMAVTETVPDIWTDEQQRDAALNRVKTEILAGKGPDVFLCENPIMQNGNKGGAVFPFPRQAMENHLLLPLDGYIEGAGRMEWDRLTPQIMEAGRNEEGQQILPLTYGFDVMAFNKEKFTLEAQLPMTFDEMLDSPDPMVRYTGGFRFLRSIFGQIEDYGRDEMLISEEDIVARIEQGREKGGEDFPQFYVDDPINDRDTCGNYAIGGYGPMSMAGGVDYWLLPRYNAEGGITATIGAFAAINRNTKLPEQSFKVVENLFTSNGQKSELLKQLNGQPVHMDVPCAGWGSSNWNDSQFAALREQINAAVFRTPVEQEFDGLMESIKAPENEGREIGDIVHEHYVKMQMMLAES